MHIDSPFLLFTVLTTILPYLGDQDVDEISISIKEDFYRDL